RPEAVARAPERHRSHVTSVPKDAPEPSTPSTKAPEPTEPGPKASKPAEQRISEPNQPPPSPPAASDLLRDIDRSTSPGEPTETPARILQDQNGDARRDTGTPAPAQPVAPTPPPKKPTIHKSAEPAFQPPSWLPTRQVAATVMYKLHLSGPSTDQFQV